jgi:hypothetical protein
MDLSTVIASLIHQSRPSEPHQRFLAMDKACKDFHAHVQKRSRSNVLFDTLMARRGLGVFDPRDIIFAHLGIIVECPRDTTPEEWNLLRVDYKKTCSELYRNVAQYLSKRIETFQLLSHIKAASDQRHPNTPLWAPNWTVKPPTFPFRRLRDSITALREQYEERHGDLEDRLNDSSGALLLRTRPESYKLWLSPLIISFLGFNMGTITQLSEAILEYNGLYNPGHAYVSSQDWGDPHSEAYQQIYSRWEDIISPLVQVGSTFEGIFRSVIRRFRIQSFQDLGLIDDQLFVHILLHETTENDRAYRHFLYGRKLAWIHECGLAVFPGAARIGDVVCFFFENTTLPFLIRPMVPAATDSRIDYKIRDAFKPKNPGKTLPVNHF